MEFEGAKKHNMEEEEAVMDERIYVALGREPAKNKSNLTWVLDNCQGYKICILLVHRPAQMIPVLGTKFDAATVDEELVRAYREKQKAKTVKILDEYLRICLRKGVLCVCVYTLLYIRDVKFPPFLRRLVLQVQAEKLCVEMNSIEKGILQTISENRVRKFIMGAASDNHYSTKMEDLRSKKAIFVCQHASVTCHIRFICKGYLIHTREARMDEVRALSALLSDFQRLVSPHSDQESGVSKRNSEEEDERASRTSSSRSASTISYFGGSEASSSVSVLEEKSNYPSPPSLPCTGMGLGMITFLINSTKLWQRLAIQNHKHGQ
ncbi:PREDICTED: U-box domain-containing protein 33-like isoform X1 [Camelina sativa]|uniref:RING-type E3 ubiquitin transferase n=1 Tax=Camelina sativa TaxID=90675 RepID=A0ABM0WCF2_CAMSA|nr:PREDICTED: U-box domain-containing protein 33-like isoform X1 [Camelina sativa]